MITTEQNLLKCLTNFNLVNPQQFLTDAEEYAKIITDEKILDHLNSGWREKLLASCCIAYKRKYILTETIVKLLFEEVEGKQIKGYLLCILALASKKQATDFILEYKRKYENTSREMQWINQSLEYLKYSPVSNNENKIAALMELFI